MNTRQLTIMGMLAPSVELVAMLLGAIDNCFLLHESASNCEQDTMPDNLVGFVYYERSIVDRLVSISLVMGLAEEWRLDN